MHVYAVYALKYIDIQIDEPFSSMAIHGKTVATFFGVCRRPHGARSGKKCISGYE
jgi:hypothetical protein